MKGLFKYLRPFLPRMAYGFVIKVLGTVAELFLPYILTHILKNVVVTRDEKAILFWGGMMIVCSAAALLFNIIANRMAAKVSKDFSGELRQKLFDKMLSLSSRQTDRFTIPSLESRITSDTYNVHHFIGMMQRMGVRAPILLMGGVCITLIMDAYLALTMVALLPFILALVIFISKKGVPLYTEVQRSVDSMTGVVREDAQGIRVIKALSKVDYENSRFDGVNARLVKSEKKAGMTMGLVNPIMTGLMNIGITVVIALSAYRTFNGLSDPETVIAFMQYFTQISMALMTVTRMFTMYTKSSASAKRITEVLETPVDIGLFQKSEYPDVKTDAHIFFDNVSFSYIGVKNDLENISFSLKKGQSLGIIGATGSGKSTLIRLLMRFFDVNSGAVYINGENIRTIPDERLTEMFGLVLQNDFLCADTIEENIRFGRDIPTEDIISAARVAQADSFITNFPDGYQHMLSQKGTNISGGQKQRVLIARALASHPEILILDDSSSALDYKTDAMLRVALKENFSDTTLVTVAQRVSSVKNSDLIIVLDEGRIIGMGDHETLLETCLEYREISESQMGGGIVE
ncbi:MAG: ABC transporter ATP-binding protein [Ruminococcaceae bacterium]|nr:ABC transporter ATP-binding protein [Oscillospiraceae bacterium]